MASTIPNQERVVDPFASYNSNVVNKITEIVTHNTEGMLTVNSMEVVLDSTSPTDTLIVQSGYAIKDDVLIKITADHIVDINDDDQYVSSQTPVESGNFYIVLDYQYLKQRPAPQANIKILKPSQRGLISGNSQYLLLKVVELSAVIPQTILGIYDYDPEVGYEDNARQYIKYYAGGEVNLPTFSKVRDQGRMAYESERDKFYFGYSSAWGELTAGGVSIDLDTDSTAVSIGELCYVNNSRQAIPAISTGLQTAADVIVTAIGTAASGIGRGTTAGFGSGVPVEPGILIGVGDILYLSDSDAGTVTNVRPEVYYQVVGRALSAGSITTPIDMIFSPKLMLALSLTGQVSVWAGPDGTGYYNDINVVSLDGTNAFDCHWFDDSTDREIRPSEVEIRNNGNIIRVYFPVNTLTVNYIIQSVSTSGGAGGGGGGGGASSHALLTELGYDASLHVGFAAGALSLAGGHNNADHLGTYIEASDVTHATLNSNGEIGEGAAQVSQGDHSHTSLDLYNYNDVPSGSIILFEKDTAVVGYSLLTDQDDMVVYITKGSVAGGESGGSLKAGGTWTQPDHTHGITSESSHTHLGGSHILTVAEMPSHRHGISNTNTENGGGDREAGPGTDTYSTYEGGDGAHDHGATSADGDHDHGGNSQADGTANSWRPRGRNLTRQQKI